MPTTTDCSANPVECDCDINLELLQNGIDNENLCSISNVAVSNSQSCALNSSECENLDINLGLGLSIFVHNTDEQGWGEGNFINVFTENKSYFHCSWPESTFNNGLFIKCEIYDGKNTVYKNTAESIP